MLKSKHTYTKTGDTTWDYFTNPTTLPEDHAVYNSWNTHESHVYGADVHSMFPGLKFTFEVVSPQELILWKEFDSLDTVMAWRDYYEALDLHPATSLLDLLNLIYPGENVADRIQFLEGYPDSVYTLPGYIDLVDKGIIQE
jgi:hypothetical protein